MHGSLPSFVGLGGDEIVSNSIVVLEGPAFDEPAADQTISHLVVQVNVPGLAIQVLIDIYRLPKHFNSFLAVVDCVLAAGNQNIRFFFGFGSSPCLAYFPI